MGPQRQDKRNDEGRGRRRGPHAHGLIAVIGNRQIAVLESWLGQRLFTKDGRRMVATPMARIFAAEIGLSFDRMAVAAEACDRPDARRLLRVDATHGTWGGVAWCACYIMPSKSLSRKGISKIN